MHIEKLFVMWEKQTKKKTNKHKLPDTPLPSVDGFLIFAPKVIRPVSYTHLDVYKRQPLK